MLKFVFNIENVREKIPLHEFLLSFEKCLAMPRGVFRGGRVWWSNPPAF